MKPFQIGNRMVGDGHPCFIIAEAGSNHNGNLEQAYCLIDAAKEVGADAVKFQTFRAKTMYPSHAGRVDYLTELGIQTDIYDLIEKMEMPFEWIPLLSDYCRKLGIIFLSTPFDEEAVDALDGHVPAFKIASYEMTHIPLVEYTARKGKPMIISTGGATLEEIEETLEVVRSTGNHHVILMQCTAKYPSPLESMDIRAMDTMREKFKVEVGLSDHTRHPLYACLAAVARGAPVIEKHFTLSNRLSGPDHAFAIEVNELKILVDGIRGVELTLGSAEKKPRTVEAELRNYHRGLFTTRHLAQGETLTSKDIVILRRAGLKSTGLKPADYQRVIGKKTSRDLQEQICLSWEDLE